ncbi:hypothetical protein A1Q2_00440 [Trichosporon asahii var. asahii CBS 8904]|uniref:Uncharacterized protein n=1 Tax=Trichosporon asahii var. asahii (strain CBS 8904) TaxID=1220162 RepID=K1VM54_TRIAC|nr:hypothetical protein A1Q2_00440 [Trichosporon asahii var. asahii CBS 8904]
MSSFSDLSNQVVLLPVDRLYLRLALGLKYDFSLETVPIEHSAQCVEVELNLDALFLEHWLVLPAFIGPSTRCLHVRCYGDTWFDIPEEEDLIHAGPPFDSLDIFTLFTGTEYGFGSPGHRAREDVKAALRGSMVVAMPRATRWSTGLETWPAKVLIMTAVTKEVSTLQPRALKTADLKPKMTTQEFLEDLHTTHLSQKEHSEAAAKSAALEDDTGDAPIPNGSSAVGETDRTTSDGGQSSQASSSSDPGIDYACAFSLVISFLDWSTLLALRGVCHLIKDAVDDYLTVPEMMFEIRPPKRPNAFLVYACIGGFDRLLPFFANASGSARQMTALRQAKAISLSGRMHPIVNFMFTQLTASATVFIDLVTGTSKCPIDLPPIRRLIIGEDQVAAWSGLALGLHVRHAAQEVEVRIPLGGSWLDWALGPLLCQTAFSSLLRPRTQRLTLRADGRVAAFLDTVKLLFPVSAHPNLNIAVALRTDEWWERVQPSGIVARRIAAVFGVRVQQVSAQVQDAGALMRWIQAAAIEERRREIARQLAAVEEETPQEELEDWEIDGDWFGKKAK